MRLHLRLAILACLVTPALLKAQLIPFAFWQRRPSPPTYVDLKHNLTTAGTSVCAVAKPTGLAVGDLMIVLLYDMSDLSGVIPPSGFLTLQSPYAMSGGYYSQKNYKIADTGDVAASNFTFTRAANFSNCGIMIIAIRGADATTPFIASHNSNLTGSVLTYTGVTTTRNNNLILLIGESAASQPSLPTGFTNHGSLGIYYTRFATRVSASAGPTGNFLSTATSGAWAATVLAIQP